MNANSKQSIGHMVGLAAAILVLLCFFFPWIELNFLLASMNISGYQLATGVGPAGSNFVGVPSLLLVPLSMLGVLAVVAASLLVQRSAGHHRGIASVLLIAAGAVSAITILYQYFNLNQQFNQSIVGMMAQKVFSYSFGAHGSLLGSIAVAGGGLIDLMTGKKPTI